MAKDTLSIIIPTLNEEGNIPELVRRLNVALRSNGIEYELIFIDDHSTDKTVALAKELALSYPISIYLKKGKPGKAYSLVEGFFYAVYDFIAFIDADLQYPPEALPEMAAKLHQGFDVIVANRKQSSDARLRKFFSKSFALFFSKFLHGLDCDVQSGLKVFRKKIIQEVTVNPSPWTFDLEFILNARNYGYKIGSVDIGFDERHAGESKINLLKASWEIGSNAIKLRLKKRSPLLIPPENNSTMLGAGIAHNRQRFITHSTLGYSVSAIDTFSSWQKILLLTIAGALLIGLLVRPLGTATAVVAVLSIVYFLDSVFNFFLVTRSLKKPPEIAITKEELAALDETTLPVYSILCPLYREAEVLPSFIEAIEKLDWPRAKLDILLLLEEDDQKTIQAAQALNLPDYVRVLVVPHSLPKTKPKACNYGLGFARGEYLVIYDAEDVPDPLQLKKAFLAFGKVPETVRCLQAKLNYYNPNQNLLTRLFTAEYSLWFDVILPGLQSINAIIPLGGTSNHFRTKDLLELQGWDPFNVTEDCDLGVRLFKRGFKTAIIDSITLEEANSNLKNWLRQRSRWIKGYLQTYLVHLRHPSAFVKESGIHALIFQLMVGGKVGFMIINPILWFTTISYFALNSLVGPTIETLYPPIIFYMAVTSFIFGNFSYLYYYMIGCAKREQWSIIKYVFLVPAYWLLVSLSAVIALWQLFVKPHFWEKTHHGLHLQKIPKKTRLASAWQTAGQYLTNFSQRLIPKKWSALIFSGEGIMVGAMLLSNFFNFLFNVFLGRALTFENLGLVTLVNTLWSVAAIFIGAFSSTVNHRSAYLATAEGKESSTSFLYSARKKGVAVVLTVSLFWLAAVPFLSRFFNIADNKVLLFFTPIFTFGMIAFANRGFLLGNLYFVAVAAIFLTESLIKLVLAGALVYLGATSWVYLTIPLSIIIIALVSLKIMKKRTPKIIEPKNFAFPGRFFAASLLAGISITVFLSLDIILVKHFLSPYLAGVYMLLSLVGKMIYFFGSLPNIFMLTFVGRAIGLRRHPKQIFTVIYLITLILSIAGVFFLGVVGNRTVPLIFGDKALNILPFLGLYTFSMALFTLFNVLISYHLAKKDYFFTTISLAASLCITGGIIIFHASINNIVLVIFWTGLVSWLVASILHLLQERLVFLKRALVDLWGAFGGKLPQSSVQAAQRKILIFNWRDSCHKFGGGAEVYIEELAKEWVKQGNRVTIFCGNDGFSPRAEIINGVEIIRRGGFYFVYIWAFVYYFLRFRNRYDVIIDCQNGIPFFTPLYVRKPVYCLMHHVHQEVFRKSLSKPLAWLAMFLEKDLMPLVYRQIPFITISESSRQAIRSLGIGQAGIQVVHPGVHLASFVAGQKSSQPIVLYLGRLKAYKSINVLILAFKNVIEHNSLARLIIAGSGEEEGNLKRLVGELGLDDKVFFAGKVSEQEKIRLLQEAWVAVNPSFMEGWGITTIEANACGTPMVAADVPGLRDSVRNPETGYLVPYGNSQAFAASILKLIENKQLRDHMGQEAVIWAQNFDWQKSSQDFMSIIENALSSRSGTLSEDTPTIFF